MRQQRISDQVNASNGGRSRRWFINLAVFICTALAAVPSANAELGCTPGTGADLSSLLDQIEALPEPGWLKANQNDFSEVWTPPDLRPLYLRSNPDPSKILLAWSGFAWDCRRGDVLLYGGGHANYSGNDTYRWRASTGRWERMSLPSQVTQDALGNWIAVDGAFSAPPAAHTYDNNVYLPIVDRFLVLGGAAFNNGGAYRIQATATTSRNTGPYTFDVARADGSRVGGTTGSHVQRVHPFPDVVGGMMWQNRDLYQFMSGLPMSFVNGATAYATENGNDVVYTSAVFGTGGTSQKLYRYVIRDPFDALQDSIEVVGTYWEGFSGRGAGSLDPVSKVFVRTALGTTAWFIYWDLNQPGPSNKNVRFMPADLSGGFALDRGYGLDHDSGRGGFLMWAGGPDVWVLRSSAVLSRDGWTIQKAPAAQTSAVPSPPPPLQSGLEVGGGVLGKWKYIPELDAFVGIDDVVKGNVWIYKPAGWKRPESPATPRISLTASPQSIYVGEQSTLSWTSTKATSCEASGAWAGAKGASGTELTPALQENQTFGLRCVGDGGESYASVTVNVLQPPTPVLSLSAAPGRIAAGGTTVLSWNTSDVSSCSAEGGWSGAKSLSGSQTVGPLSEPTTFGLRCLGPGGEVFQSTLVDVVDNRAPSVALIEPSGSTSVITGGSLLLEANASDVDGTIIRVEFFDGASKVGEVTSAPYRFNWVASGLGTHVITARAIDDLGGAGVSESVSIEVVASGGGGTTVTLQRGLAPGMQVADTYLSNWSKNSNLGTRSDLSDQYSNYTVLVRFAIFQSEGGPVPDGAVIKSATLSLYKYTSYNMTYGVHRVLKDWTETGATWNQTGRGVAWALGGANGAGTDFEATADSIFAVAWSPEWMNFDVTASVGLFSSATAANYGWRLRAVSGYLAGLKSSASSEYASAPELRPRLVVTYE